MKNDVYEFRYSEEYIKTLSYKDGLYHCFDGTLIEKVSSDGSVYYEDTYWGSGESRHFQSLEELQTKGNIKLLCNLDEMQEIAEHECKYYNEDDVVYLRIHAGYRSKYLIKKGVQKSKEVILNGMRNKIKEIESNIEYEIKKIEWLKRDIQEVESGEKELKHIYF